MNRRELLATTALLACAGCLGDGDDRASNDSTAEPTDGAATTAGSTETDAVDTAETTTATTDTATTSTGSTATTTGGGATGTTTEACTETPGRATAGRTTDGATTNGSAADRSFTVVETGDEAGNEASVAIENDGSRIVVTGTITGENGCRTATLDSVRIDAGEVRIVVATERAPDADAVCSQALVGIGYRATVTVERRPESVTVIHRGAGGEETVATTEPGA
ncbi:hypothetical protein BRC98_06055 [Halobacteriales archaeon QS_7_68_65]|nr:MAG: hypothetical protein BRC98_06055 [Halobacteriales archaeon QS_7_68_65]